MYCDPQTLEIAHSKRIVDNRLLSVWNSHQLALFLVKQTTHRNCLLFDWLLWFSSGGLGWGTSFSRGSCSSWGWGSTTGTSTDSEEVLEVSSSDGLQEE